jgi:hypothetical protein
MSLMMITAIIISLSNLLPSTETNVEEAEMDSSIPIFVPLIIATTMPVISAFFSLFGRYMQVTMKMDPRNWSLGYNLLYAFTFLVAGIVHFSMYPEEFVFDFAWKGSIGSLVNTCGSMAAGAALGTGAPIGPMIALMNTQMVFMTLITAFI